MSDSRYIRNRSDSPSVSRQLTEGLSIGWIVSIVVHAAIICLTIFYKPFRDAIFSPPRQETRISAPTQTIREVSQVVRDTRKEQILLNLQRMRTALSEIERLRRQRLDAYQQYKQQMATTAPQRVDLAMQKALEAQLKTLDQQKQDQHEQALLSQAEVDGQQQVARRFLDMGGLTKTLESQQAAIAAQAVANERQIHAKRLLDELPSLEQRISRLQQQIEKSYQPDVDTEEARLKDALQAVEQRKAEHKQAVETAEAHQPAVASAKQAVEAATQALAAAQAGEDRKAIDTADKNLKRAQRELELAESRAKRHAEAVERAAARIGSAESQADRHQRNLQIKRERLEKAQQELADTQAKLQSLRQEIPQAVAAARDAQADAAEQQKHAIAALVSEIRELQEQSQPVVADADQTDTIDPPPEPLLLPSRSLSQLSLAELYELARVAEAQVTERYRELRAADLAMVREISLGEAIEQTDVPRPIRPELDTALLNATADDPGRLELQKSEIAAAIRETESMASLADQLMGTALAAEARAQRGADIAMITIPASEDRIQAVTDTGQAFLDLRGLMAGSPQASAAGPGGVPDQVPIIPKELLRTFQPSRRVASTGVPAKYIFVDTWYVIGPFPNPERKYMDQAYEPESVIDLDAVYFKDGRELRWQFTQNNDARIEPVVVHQDAIYYAYTELYFDQPQELMMAVGSDDYSKIWINGELVYVSGRQQKNWNPTEAWRLVRFRQGVNRILYRVENGWKGMGWSMVLALDPS